MTTVVEASLPAEALGLSETLERHPEARFEVLRLVVGGDGPAPLVWAAGEDLRGLCDQVAADASVADAEVVLDVGEAALLRVDWQPAVEVVFDVLREGGATVVDATASDGTWRFSALFPEREGVSRSHDLCAAYGLDLCVERIYRPSESLRPDQYGLSQDQHETILRAHQAGYYRVPRTTTLQELSDRFGVSHQALSERLRRGHETLIANTLQPEGEPTVRP